LLVLPIENSLLYVEPLYLRAENGQIPELRRVILAAGDQIVMEETLDKALSVLLEGEGVFVPSETAGTEETPATTGTPAPQPTLDVSLSDDVGELSLRATRHYDAAQAALRQGDWATYGQELAQLKAVLDKLVSLTDQPQPQE
jgi:uncharacterized membrane protein (UPF0182 family)